MAAPPLLRATVAAVLTGTAAMAAWVLLSRATNGAVRPPPLAYIPMLAESDWKKRVLAATIKSESSGNYAAVNPNADGAGLSFGLIQWAQRPGSLGNLLAAFWAKDPARFKAVFGPDSNELLTTTKKGGVVPVAGAYLWQEPWLSRFKQAGADPVFRQVQDDLILNGSYMQDAIAASRILGGPPTERGMALLFDVSVNQGGYVKTLASKAAAATPNADFATRLAAFAKLAPARFSSSTPQSSSWKQVATGVYHKFAGKWDLYTNIQKRVAKIQSHPLLTDQTVIV